jgi:hypothetical protein
MRFLRNVEGETRRQRIRKIKKKKGENLKSRPSKNKKLNKMVWACFKTEQHRLQKGNSQHETLRKILKNKSEIKMGTG